MKDPIQQIEERIKSDIEFMKVDYVVVLKHQHIQDIQNLLKLVKVYENKMQMVETNFDLANALSKELIQIKKEIFGSNQEKKE